MNRHQRSQYSQQRKALSASANIAWVGMLIAVLFIGLMVYAFISLIDNNETSSTQVTQRQTVAEDGNKIVSKTEQTIAGVVERVSPSVVSIVVSSEGIDAQSPLRRYNVSTGAGTGIIVSKDGYVLTNKHVIENANKVKITTASGDVYDDVKILGTDPLNDLAFLKINGVNSLTAAELGDSTTVRVGQEVIAIGNSLGQYQNTVTSGIISGTGRPILASDLEGARSSADSLVDLLQTDAAINPGNSGGPLLNASGQVIGINTAVAADAQGIGFAIPVNAAKGMLKQVLAGKPVERAYLGVQYLSIDKAFAKDGELPVDKGAYIYSAGSSSPVVKGSPADKAGMKEGDIITHINDIEVGKAAGFSSLIAEYAPNDTIKLTIIRDGKTINTNVTLSTYRAQ